MTDLVERARALALAIDFSPDDLGGEIGTASLRNPDGKELLSIVEALSERIAVLEQNYYILKAELEAARQKYAQSCFDHEYITPGCPACGKMA